MSFVDAILQYGEKINQDEATKAVKIAGKMYENCLRDYFLILSDKNLPMIPIPSPRPTTTLSDPNVIQASISNALKRKRDGSNNDEPESNKKTK